MKLKEKLSEEYADEKRSLFPIWQIEMFFSQDHISDAYIAGFDKAKELIIGRFFTEYMDGHGIKYDEGKYLFRKDIEELGE